METDRSSSGPEDDLTPFEQRLVAWQPATGGLDRDRMLFDAGRATARSEHDGRLWPLATAASILMTVALGGLLARERSERHAIESLIAARDDPQNGPWTSTSPSPRLTTIGAAGPDSYLALTSRLASGGRDLSLLDIELEPEPLRPSPASSNRSQSVQPLRPGDLDRVRDL